MLWETVNQFNHLHEVDKKQTTKPRMSDDQIWPKGEKKMEYLNGSLYLLTLDFPHKEYYRALSGIVGKFYQAVKK